MLSEPGFWLMIAGGLLVAVAFIGLAFNRIGSETPVHSANVEEQQAPTPTELPNPLSTDGKTEVAKVFGRAGPKPTG